MMTPEQLVAYVERQLGGTGPVTPTVRELALAGMVLGLAKHVSWGLVRTEIPEDAKRVLRLDDLPPVDSEKTA